MLSFSSICAQKLKLPPSYFLCRDEKEEAEYKKTVKIKDARRLLGTAQYKKCIDTCSELPSDDDEVAFIGVCAHILWAIQLFDKGELSDASSLLDHTVSALHKTVYMYSELQSQIKFLRVLISALSNGAPADISHLPELAPMFFSKDRYLYILALNHPSFPIDALTQNSIYRTHLEGRRLLLQERFTDASPLLEKVLKEAQDSYTRYFALLDLERALEAEGNFKAAYNLAKIRIDLNTKYSV